MRAGGRGLDARVLRARVVAHVRPHATQVASDEVVLGVRRHAPERRQVVHETTGPRVATAHVRLALLHDRARATPALVSTARVADEADGGIRRPACWVRHRAEWRPRRRWRAAGDRDYACRR